MTARHAAPRFFSTSTMSSNSILSSTLQTSSRVSCRLVTGYHTTAPLETESLDSVTPPLPASTPTCRLMQRYVRRRQLIIKALERRVKSALGYIPQINGEEYGH